MEVVYRRCSGIDVHKESISVCVLLMEDEGVKKQIRRFGTMTRDLLELSLWLQQLGVTHVAMESTGVYWKPVWNLLEGQFELLLVNAQHIKQVPGRKTDIRDCEWIADLLQHGLLRRSYVPKQEQRDLRDLTRYRVRLNEDKVRLANRIQKTLEDANIKLASVATDVLGASGRTMLQAIATGEDDPEKLAQMARKGLRKTYPITVGAARADPRSSSFPPPPTSRGTEVYRGEDQRTRSTHSAVYAPTPSCHLVVDLDARRPHDNRLEFSGRDWHQSRTVSSG